MMTLDEMIEKAVPRDDFDKIIEQMEFDSVPDEEGDDQKVGLSIQELRDLDIEEDLPPDTDLRAGAIGLSARQRVYARKRMKRAMVLSWQHRGNVHYTQRVPGRWPISTGVRSKRHQYIRNADCSGGATYIHWDATVDHHLRDFVNGFSWKYGYTGSMVLHGVRIRRPMLVGDCVFYGGSYMLPKHVAVYIGAGKVWSHGQESGPLILPWNYRSVVQTRRYLR